VPKTLKEAGLEDKTMVIVTSDHGEAFAEHGMIRHGFEVWEELVHVPLIVYVPGAEARRVSVRRSLIDVSPTIAQAFGLDLKEADFAGSSLLADILASKESGAEVRPVLVDMPQGPHNQERRAFYSDQYKLIVSAGRVLGLYDLEKDPGEKNDLSEDSALLAQVRQRYDAFASELQPVAARK
jgi:arylsulfatase A-like enzyme